MPSFPPGPGPVAAFVGMFPGRDMMRVPAFLQQTALRYGPVSSWQIGRRRFYFINEPALIEDVLVTHGRSFVKGRGTQRLDRLLGRGLLTSNGAFHLQQRRLVQPAFHRERIAGYATTIVARAAAFAASIAPDATVEIDAAMYRLTLGIAAETLFGANVDAQAETIGGALDRAMASFPASLSPVGELMDHLPMVPYVRRFLDARATLDAIVYGIIDERVRDGRDRGDMLSLLLASRGDDGSATMSREQVRDEAMTAFLAGHETTANALAWTWWLLAQHPDVADRLERSLDAALGDRLPTMDDVPALGLARDIVAEAMRLYPPAWVIGRRATEPVQIGPWALPRDGIVLASPWITHRDPRFWSEPEAFRPERWSNGETAALPKFAYYPFGGGNRVCIGEAFAWTETVLVLATVAQRWRFRPAPGLTTVPAKQLVTMRPLTAIPLVAQARTPAARVAAGSGL